MPAFVRRPASTSARITRRRSARAAEAAASAFLTRSRALWTLDIGSATLPGSRTIAAVLRTATLTLTARHAACKSATHRDDPRPGHGLDFLEVANNRETCSALESELWPDDDDDTEGAEYYEAIARAARLRADVFAMLAGPFGQEFLVSQAMDAAEQSVRFAANAESAIQGGDDAR